MEVMTSLLSLFWKICNTGKRETETSSILPGMHHQGVFRVSGSQHEINEFKNAFERGRCKTTFCVHIV